LAGSSWYDFYLPSHKQQPSATLIYPSRIASNSNELKPANHDPQTSRNGSGSADLDRGVIGDDDDDDEEAEENGVIPETPNVGKLNQPLSGSRSGQPPLTVYP
jgi:hypothetical protein